MHQTALSQANSSGWTALLTVWINANLVGAYANLFTNNQSYPFNQNGYGAIQAATIDVLTRL
jgi:hypothetical protein